VGITTYIKDSTGVILSDSIVPLNSGGHPVTASSTFKTIDLSSIVASPIIIEVQNTGAWIPDPNSTRRYWNLGEELHGMWIEFQDGEIVDVSIDTPLDVQLDGSTLTLTGAKNTNSVVTITVDNEATVGTITLLDSTHWSCDLLVPVEVPTTITATCLYNATTSAVSITVWGNTPNKVTVS
jgi:hypothetical protein